MSKGSIPVSKNHGVNPTIPICFWCGKDKNEIALLGKLPGDRQAPMRAVVDYNPCPECQENMNKGITFVEVDNKPIAKGFPEIQGGAYPTGRWVVVTEDYVKQAFTEDFANAVLVAKKALISSDQFKHFTIDIPDGDGTENAAE